MSGGIRARLQLGTGALALFFGVALAATAAASIAAAAGWFGARDVLIVAFSTSAGAVTSLAILSMLRRRISAIERDVRHDVGQLGVALRTEVLKSLEDVRLQVRAVKRTTDTHFARDAAVLAPLEQAAIFTFDHGGRKIRFDISPLQHIHEEIRAYGEFYEREMLKYIEDNFTKGMVIVDVGSNIGNHAVFFGAIMQASPLVCVEASSAAARHLERNLALNDVKNVHLVEKALGSSPGRGSLWLPLDQAGNTGAARLVTGEGNIEISTLDAELAALNIPKIGLIKIDVEGMELEVLKGALRTLESSHPDLFVELQTPELTDKVMALLSPLGYRLGRRFNVTPTYHISKSS